MVSVRVFYSPQCPTVFPSLDELDRVCARHGCSFDRVNIYEEEGLGPCATRTCPRRSCRMLLTVSIIWGKLRMLCKVWAKDPRNRP